MRDPLPPTGRRLQAADEATGEAVGNAPDPAASGANSNATAAPSFAPTLLPTHSSLPTSPPSIAVVDSRGVYAGITLQAIGLTLGGGLCVSLLTVLAFGIAVMVRHTNVAPRCTSRHPNTIWRSRRDMYGRRKLRRGRSAGEEDKKKRDAWDEEGEASDVVFVRSRSQDPSSPNRHSSSGAVAGSHTANGGGDNNDGFNSRISSANDLSILGESIIKDNDSKVYAHPQDRGNPFLGWIPWTLHLSYDRMLRGIPGTGTREGGMGGKLLGVNLDAIVLFRYHALCLRVTAVVCFICIGIILPLNLTACYEDADCNEDLTNYGRTTIANLVYIDTETTSNSPFSSWFWAGQNVPTLIRLYAYALCTWYITWFVLKNIERDWRENLVLRRVYYLEADHYGNRQNELGGTVYRPEAEGDATAGDDGEGNVVSTGKHKHRNPWIPNPEHRDTVPSIELYSVLVGGLPSLPDEIVNSKDEMKAALGFSNRANIDWQLAVATTFFDHIVPNQPGFSSSVVAVTILPGAPELARAWRKWYAAAAALRRLRFVREVINDKRYYAIDDDTDDAEDISPGNESVPEEQGVEAEWLASPDKQVTFLDHDPSAGIFEDVETGLPISPGSQHQTAQEAADKDYRLFRSLNYGPEQQAMYTREFAQGAAACCPNGCCEERVRRQPIDKLVEMEDATIVRLEKAQYELQCAQMQAAVSTVEGSDKKVKEPKEGLAPPANSLIGLEGEPTLEDIATAPVAREPTNGMSGQGLTIDVSPRTLGSSSGEDQGAVFRGHSGSNGNYSPIPPGASSLRMNAEGRFLFNSDGAANDDIDVSGVSRVPSREPSLRRRTNTLHSALSEGDVSQWNQVNTILRKTHEADDQYESGSRNNYGIATGVWEKPSVTVKSFMSAVKTDLCSGLKATGRWTKGKTDPVRKAMAKDSTYAVVTFSSRQAAVAARHCLADGRGVQKWLSVESVPVAPLADAAPCDIITCRGCCRPVTLNLNHNQLMIRRYIALASLAFIYIFYTIPITAAQSLVSPQKLEETLPALYDWMSDRQYISAGMLSGLVAALLYTTFFALCPVMFKAIANSGSQATSVQEAEKYALKYYWFFMLVTAFVFTGLAEAAISIWNSSNVESSLEALLRTIAEQTPLTTAATWLNWIIVRTTMTLPLQYLLQVNSFIFGCIGWKCCARCVMGGGPGGPIPYRIYIDCGVVFLCVVALAPQSPLVAPVALLYYLFCVPLWRRNCIFMYRPKFDSGGERWPFLSDMLLHSLFMGQFLLTLQMVLKDAFGPALIAACPAIPTYLFRNYLIKRFRRAYDDAGLLQTSLLDGWDNTMPTSVENREEFRKFLVDAHKAAYIPVCIAGGATNILTAEPAVVMPSDNDDLIGYTDVAPNEAASSPFGNPPHNSPPANGTMSDVEGFSTPNLSSQRGACVRRAMSFSAHTPSSTTNAVRSFATPRAAAI